MMICQVDLVSLDRLVVGLSGRFLESKIETHP